MLDQIENTQQTLSGGYPVCWTRQRIHSKHYKVDIRSLDWIVDTQQTLSGGFPVCWTRQRIHSKHYQVDIQYVGLDREYIANIIWWISGMLDQIETTQQTVSGGYPVCWTRQRIHSKYYHVWISGMLDQIENTQQTLSGGYPVCWTRQ